MLRKTHLGIGAVVTLGLVSLTYISPLDGLIGLVGATFPDIDYKIGIKHRTITHSLIGLLGSTLFVYYFAPKVALVFGLNYLLHLVADSFTKTGVPYLYPFSKKTYGKKLIVTGKAEDGFILLLALLCISIILQNM